MHVSRRFPVSHVALNWQGIALPLLCAGCFAALFSGCSSGSSAGNRVAIAGKVLKEGAPIPGKATLVLDPEDKSSIGTMAEVRDGSFTIPQEMGPTPGQKFKVILTTAPGIPADGTPKDKIRLPEKLTGTIEIPPKGTQELLINVK